jgi:hypothetical protein
MFHNPLLALALAVTASLPVVAQDSDSKDKPFDVRSSVGDLHVGKDASAEKAGLPLYPGARPKQEDNNDPLNFGVLTEAFGMKIIVAKYESDDAPAKIIGFYRDRLKKYGAVLECHSQKHGSGVEVNSGDDSDKGKDGKELKCEEQSGPVTELKVGVEDNQHVVAVEPHDGDKGSTFAIVYLYARKKGDI